MTEMDRCWELTRPEHDGLCRLAVVGHRAGLCEAGVVRSQAKGSLESRLVEIHAGVREVIASFAPRRRWRWKNCTATTNGRVPRS